MRSLQGVSIWIFIGFACVTAQAQVAGDNITIRSPVWACPTTATLEKFMRASKEVEPGKETALSLTAHLEWGCVLFTNGDIVVVGERSVNYISVHRRGEMTDFWTLPGLLRR